MEEDGIINRTVFPEVPLRVEYSLIDKGKEFFKIIEVMEKFGEKFS